MASSREMGTKAPDRKRRLRRRLLRLSLAALVAGLAAGGLAAPSAGAEEGSKRAWLIAYEVLPGAGKKLPA